MAKIYNEKCPCKDCTQRQVGCHSKCFKYLYWKHTGIEQPKKDYVKYDKRGRREK